MKKRSDRNRITGAVALVAALVLLAGCGGKPAPAAEEPKADKRQEKQETAAFSPASTGPVLARDEAVLVSANADGSIRRIEDRVTVSGDGGSEGLVDRTILEDIENLDGDERFVLDGDELCWENLGRDIVYRGTSSKELPVTVKVSCSLDGKKISPDKLDGKNGRLKMRISYENHTGRGSYIPYLSLTLLSLDTERFHNLTTSGNLVNLGYSLVVYDIAAPGLGDFLSHRVGRGVGDDLDRDLVLEADVEDCRIDQFQVLVTSGSFAGLDDEWLGELADAGEKMDRSQELSEEIDGSLQGSVSDVNSLTEGSRRVAAGAGTVSDGLAGLSDEIDSFSESAKGLSDNLQRFEDGAAELEAGLSELQSQVQFLPNSRSTLERASDLLRQVSAYLSRISDRISALDAAIASSEAAGDEETARILRELRAEISSGSELQTLISSAGDLQTALDEAPDKLDAFYEGLGSATKGAGDLKAGASEMKTAASGMDASISSARDSVGTMENGAKQLREGSWMLNSGSLELADSLDDWLEMLSGEGFKKGNLNLSALADAIGELRDADGNAPAYGSPEEERIPGSTVYLITIGG